MRESLTILYLPQPGFIHDLLDLGIEISKAAPNESTYEKWEYILVDLGELVTPETIGWVAAVQVDYLNS